MVAIAAKSEKSDEDYQAEEDVRTLNRVGEIMNDPKRYARAKKQMEKMMAIMKKSEIVMKKVMKKEKPESMGDAMTRAREAHRA